MISFVTKPCAIVALLASAFSSIALSDAFSPATPRQSAFASARTARFLPTTTSVQKMIGSSRILTNGSRILARGMTASSTPAELTFGYEDLIPGDIICWETGNSALEKLVAHLSDDKYSHSAIVSSDPPKVFESVGEGVREKSFVGDDTRENRRTTVTRLEGIDVDPIFNAARFDVDGNVPYGFDSLGYLAVLLLLNKPELLLTGSETVEEGVLEFINYLNKAGGGNADSTFCSEFVYKCFEQGGITLKIDNPAIPRTRASQGSSILSLVIEEVSNMEDLSEEDFKKNFTSFSSAGRSSRDDADAEASLNESANNLLKSLLEEDKKVGERSVSAKALDKELFQAIIEFALVTDGNTIPDGFDEWKEQVNAALSNIEKKALVTPGELTRIANESAEILWNFEIPK